MNTLSDMEPARLHAENHHWSASRALESVVTTAALIARKVRDGSRGMSAGGICTKKRNTKQKKIERSTAGIEKNAKQVRGNQVAICGCFFLRDTCRAHTNRYQIYFVFIFPRFSPAPVGLFSRFWLQGTEEAGRYLRRRWGFLPSSVARAVDVHKRSAALVQGIAFRFAELCRNH